MPLELIKLMCSMPTQQQCWSLYVPVCTIFSLGLSTVRELYMNCPSPRWPILHPGCTTLLQMIRILKELVFHEMEDVMGLTSGQAGEIKANDSQGSYSMAAEKQKAKQMVLAVGGAKYNVRDPEIVAEVAGLKVTRGDYNRLHDGIYLNDVIIDYYLHHIERQIPEAERARFRILSPHFYGLLRSSPAKAAAGWDRNRSFFDHDFVFMPVPLLLVPRPCTHAFTPLNPSTTSSHAHRPPDPQLMRTTAPAKPKLQAGISLYMVDAPALAPKVQ